MPAESGAGADPAAGAAPLEIEQIRPNLYLLRGGGRTIAVGGSTLPTAGTTAVLVGSRGVTLVDTKLPGWGAPILRKLEEITDKPVTTVINTHTHMDHVGGNVELPRGVEVVAHETTAELMREMRPVAGGPAQPNLFHEAGGRGLPTRTFRDRLTWSNGEESIELYYFGRAHTGGDAWVVFSSLSVVHAGDVFAHKAIPPIDVNNGASGLDYPRTIERALAQLPSIATVVTGHYPRTLERSDLATYGDFVDDFVRAIGRERETGGSIDGFVESWALSERLRAQGYVDFSHLRSIRPDVEAIWKEIDRKS